MRFLLALLFFTCGCSVEVDLTGVPCDAERPCAPGWSCAGGVCVDCVDQDDPTALVRVGELRAEWTTPESIQWRWQVEGDEGDLDHYEVLLGPSAEAVCYRRDTVRVITPDESPELGELSFRMTSVVNLVDHTITDGLDPSTPYHARLIAIDTAGRRSVSQIAGDSTRAPASSSFPIFTDQLDDGWYARGFTRRVDGSGSGYLEMTQSCPDGAADCWTNAGLQNDSSPQISDARGTLLTLGNFENAAFLELTLTTESGVRARYGEVKMAFGEECNLFFLSPFAMRADSQPHKVQVPLRVLVDLRACRDETPNELPLTHEEASRGVAAVTIGASWDQGSVVRLDDVRVRW